MFLFVIKLLCFAVQINCNQRLPFTANITLCNYSKKQKRGIKNAHKQFVSKYRNFGTNQCSFYNLYLWWHNPYLATPAPAGCIIDLQVTVNLVLHKRR